MSGIPGRYLLQPSVFPKTKRRKQRREFILTRALPQTGHAARCARIGWLDATKVARWTHTQTRFAMRVAMPRDCAAWANASDRCCVVAPQLVRANPAAGFTK